MTQAARQILSDAGLALGMLQAETDPDRWRVHWAGGVALLRAVGHVLLNVDQRADAALAKAADAAHRGWRSPDPAHAVYREFILEERNNILKEYRSKVHPLAEVPVAIRMTLMNPATGEIRGDDGKPKQMWFALPDQPIGFFAGLWQQTERGEAYAFVTTKPNEFVKPWHPKAMPAILSPADLTGWLDGTLAEAKALVRPYAGEMIRQVDTPSDELIEIDA